jgi:hypothetical protein
MKKLFAFLTVVAVTFGALSAVPANASKTYFNSGTQYEGGANN